jgi:predicted nucleic acid-binding protein
MAISNDLLLRVMVDTNVLIAGTVWPRWPYEVLQHAITGDYQLVLCRQVVDEGGRRINARFPSYLDEFLQLLADAQFEMVVDPAPAEVMAHRELLRDLTDVPIVLAAIQAQVNCFVTTDKDFTDPSNAELHRRLKIVLPAVFLRDYMGWTSDALEAIRNRTW